MPRVIAPVQRQALPLMQCTIGQRHISISCVRSGIMDSLNPDPKKTPKHIPGKGDLVYVGMITPQVKIIKGFSLTTSMLGLAIQPILLQQTSEMPIFLKTGIVSTASFFIFLTPLMLHWITKRYVSQLYFDRNTGVFTATTYSFFLRRRDLKFTAADVTHPEVPGIFTTVKAKNQALFLNLEDFCDREAAIHMMGYDKPLQWEMEPDDSHVEAIDPKKKL